MKHTKLILLILCISLLLSTLSSCSSKDPEELEPLSEELKAEIIAAAEEEWGEDIGMIWGSFGIFDEDKVAVRCDLSVSHYPISHTVKVAYKEFELPTPACDIYVYYDTEFTQLSEAYNKGMVSKGNVSDIHYYYKEYEDIRHQYYEENNESLLEYLIFGSMYR